jgi:DNA-binding FrmR family transcriptional regulator
MSTSIAIEQLVVKALGEAVSRIAKKVSEGKRLSDREVVVLVMSLMMRRFEDFREHVDKRFEDFKAYVDGRFNAVEKRMDGLERKMESLEKRIDVVYSEISSVKTDIVKMMKELLEKAYGERKD